MVDQNAKSIWITGEIRYSGVVLDVNYESLTEIQTFKMADLIWRTWIQKVACWSKSALESF